MKEYYIALILLFLLTGCAHNADNKVWYKPGASTDAFNVDKYDCMQQSQQKSSGAYVNPYGGAARSGSITNLGLFNACMNAKGWSLQDSKTLPKPVDQNSDEFKQKKVIVDNTMKAFAEKYKAICAKSEYAALFVKSACKTEDITFEQIAYNTKITPEEKTILPKYLTEVDAVTKERQKYLHTLTGPLDIRWVDYLDSIQSEIDKYKLDLFNEVITWGEYNQRRKDMNARIQSEYRKIYHPPN